MSTIGDVNLNLADWVARLNPDKSIAAIVELLRESNPIITDMVMVEGNLPTGHRTTVRSGLPGVTWRQLNYGVQPTKSRAVQVTDSIGMLEAYSDVDKSLADLNGNTAAFRASEDRAFIMAMANEFASTLFYGNTAIDPEKFMGLAPRYNALTADDNSANILDGGSNDTDNTSIWLLTWDESVLHGIFPKGSPIGLSVEDLGQVTLDDSQSPPGHYEGYRSHYKWDSGLTLRDWRGCVRIANIEISDLIKAASSGADLVDLMVQALELLPAELDAMSKTFYCNRTIRSMLRRQISNNSNVNLNLDNVGGERVLTFDGVPVRRCDALLNTETLLT